VKNLLLASFVLLYALCSEAQNIIIKKSDAEINPAYQELQLCPNGDYIALSSGYSNDPLVISRFDPRTLTPRYTNSLQEFKKDIYRASAYGGDRLFVFTTNDKEGSISRYEIDDRNGSVTGAPVTLFKVDKVYDYDYSFGSSPNGQFHYLMAAKYDRKKKTTFLQGVIMDQHINKIGNFSTTIEADRQDLTVFTNFSALQADDGLLSIICVGATQSDKTDYRPMSYTLIQIDIKGKVNSAPMEGMPSGALKNFIWTTNGRQLSFMAFQLKNSKSTGFTHFVTAAYDPLQKKCSDIREFELNAILKLPPVDKLPDMIKEFQRSGLRWDVGVKKMIPLSDGSKCLILEGSNSLSIMSGFGPSPYSPATFNTPGAGTQASAGSIPYYQRLDLYILKMDKNNIPQWFEVFPKWQEEPDHAISIGTAAMADSHDNVHLFVYDHEKDLDAFSPHIYHVYPFRYKSGKLADVMVTPEGKITKQLYEVQDPEFRLRPETAITSQKNVVLLMAIKYHASQTHAFESSHYKMATIEVK
jgi:hypothetical protein